MLPDILDIRMKYGLPESMATLLQKFLQEKLMAPDMFPSGTSPRVQVYRLKGALPDWVTVHSSRRLGYWLDDDTKERICSDITVPKTHRENVGETSGDQ